MNESLKIAACIESRMCVWLCQGDGAWFAFHHGDDVLCSSLELFPCKAPTLSAEAIPLALWRALDCLKLRHAAV